MIKINNLRFGTKKLTNKFKLIKRRAKIRLTAASLAIIIALSGCKSFAPNKSYNKVENNTTQQQVIHSDYNSSNNNFIYNNNYEYDMSFDYNSFYNQNVQNFDLNNEFKNYINSYDIGYNYIDYYNIDSLLDKNINTIDLKTEYSNNQIVTGEQLYKIVLNNNNTFMSNSINRNFYDEFGNNKLKKICNIIMDVINKYINSENKNEVHAVLNNLKILSKNITSNGYVSDNDILAISENKSFNGETFENIVVHEAVHLLQKNSEQNIKDGSKRVGVCIKWEDEKINSLDWSWFYESSAAKCMENTLNTTSGSYKNDLNYLNLLKLTTILNAKSSTELEEICNNKNINNLFDYFNCDNDKDKKELVAMMYSIEIINNKPTEILEIIQKNDSSSISELRSDIYVNLSKHFYKNLSIGIKNNNISLNEIFSLINLFESNVNYNLVTNYYGKFDKNKTFMQEYSEIQNQFFYQLGISFNVSYDVIYDAFISYVMNNKNSNANSINIKCLNTDANEWLVTKQNEFSSQSSSIIQEDYYNFLESIDKTKS